MTFEKEKITITLKGESEITTFWHILMFALDYNTIAQKSKKHECTLMDESELKLANELIEVTKPHYG